MQGRKSLRRGEEHLGQEPCRAPASRPQLQTQGGSRGMLSAWPQHPRLWFPGDGFLTVDCGQDLHPFAPGIPHADKWDEKHLPSQLAGLSG